MAVLLPPFLFYRSKKSMDRRSLRFAKIPELRDTWRIFLSRGLSLSQKLAFLPLAIRT